MPRMTRQPAMAAETPWPPWKLFLFFLGDLDQALQHIAGGLAPPQLLVGPELRINCTNRRRNLRPHQVVIPYIRRHPQNLCQLLQSKPSDLFKSGRKAIAQTCINFTVNTRVGLWRPRR